MSAKLSPFDFLNNINDAKKSPNLLKDCYANNDDEGANPDSLDKQYVSFMINRGLSYFSDTIHYANEMNINHTLPAKMQYDFYRNIIRPRKRFSKWAKKEDDSSDIKVVMSYYNYSSDKAREIIDLLSSDDLEAIRAKSNKGGTGK
jgi:hypothetical protein